MKLTGATDLPKQGPDTTLTVGCPRFWDVVRRLAENPEFFAKVAELAQGYSQELPNP